MEFSGFFTSWATPAVTRPSAARRSETCNCRLIVSKRLEVAQGDQSAHARTAFADHLHADADALRRQTGIGGGNINLRGRYGLKFVFGQNESGAQRVARRKNLARFAAQQLISGRAEEIFHRGADHHGAAIAREQQQAVFQAAENLVQIFSQRTEDFAHPAQLQSDLADFGAHLPELIATLERLLVEFAS